MKRILFIVVVSTLLFGCRSKEEQQISFYNNDFEVMGNWSTKEQLTTEASHSGTFSTFTDSTFIFSQTMVASGKQLKNKTVKGITASVWVMSTRSPVVRWQAIGTPSTQACVVKTCE